MKRSRLIRRRTSANVTELNAVSTASFRRPSCQVRALYDRIWDKHVPPTFCQQRLQVFYLATTSALIQSSIHEKRTPPGCHLCHRLQHIYTRLAHSSAVLLWVCSDMTCSCTWIYVGINKGRLVQQGKLMFRAKGSGTAAASAQKGAICHCFPSLPSPFLPSFLPSFHPSWPRWFPPFCSSSIIMCCFLA